MKMFRVYTNNSEFIIYADKWEITEDGKVTFYNEHLLEKEIRAIINLNNVLGFSEVR